MPNLNRFDILSISIFCKIALSISISISIFSKITISIFWKLPYRYRYRYRYFSELPYQYQYRYQYFQLLHIDINIDIDIFQKCRYIDNRYVISIYRTGLEASRSEKVEDRLSCNTSLSTHIWARSCLFFLADLIVIPLQTILLPFSFLHPKLSKV